MPNNIDATIADYLKRLRRNLRGLSRDETTECVLEIEDHIRSALCRNGTGKTQAEELQIILAKMGSPKELAAKYSRPWPPWCRRVLAAAIVGVAAMVLALLAYHTGQNNGNDDSESVIAAHGTIAPEQAAEQLREVFAAYRNLDSLSARVRFETRLHGHYQYRRYNLFHKDDRTVLSPYDGSDPHAYLTADRSLIYLPATRTYLESEQLELEDPALGKSLTLSLLHNILAPAQTNITAADIRSAMVCDSGVRYEGTGVYFGWGDVRFTIIVDPEENTIKHFSVMRNRVSENYPHQDNMVYRASYSFIKLNPEIDDAIFEFPISPDIKRVESLPRFCFTSENTEKGDHLVGQSLAGVSGIDRRNGKPVSLADYRGNYVLLTTCAAWIPSGIPPSHGRKTAACPS